MLNPSLDISSNEQSGRNRTELDFADPLLSFLRRRLERADVDYLERPSRFIGGDNTIVAGFKLRGAPPPLDRPLVLRALLDPTHTDRARIELTAHECVRAQGFPAPAVFLHDIAGEVMGWPFLIMERMPGQVGLEGLLTHLRKGSWLGLSRDGGFLVRKLPVLIGRTTAALHELPAGSFRQELRARGIDPAALGVDRLLGVIRDRTERLGSQSLSRAVDWLWMHRPPQPAKPSICHGDIHPLNLILQDGKVTGVVDWGSVMLAHPELDLGIIRSLPVSLLPLGPVPLVLVHWLQRGFVRSVEREYRRIRPINTEVIRYYEALHLVFIATSVMERRRNRATCLKNGGLHGGDNPITLGRVERRTRMLTGLSLSLSPAR